MVKKTAKKTAPPFKSRISRSAAAAAEIVGRNGNGSTTTVAPPTATQPRSKFAGYSKLGLRLSPENEQWLRDEAHRRRVDLSLIVNELMDERRG